MAWYLVFIIWVYLSMVGNWTDIPTTLVRFQLDPFVPIVKETSRIASNDLSRVRIPVGTYIALIVYRIGLLASDHENNLFKM